MIKYVIWLLLEYFISLNQGQYDICKARCPALNDNPPLFRYDYRSIENGEGYIKHHNAPATWKAAKRVCRLEGAELASPINLAIYNSMKSIVACANNDLIHTGFSSEFVPGKIISVSGYPFNIAMIDDDPDWRLDYRSKWRDYDANVKGYSHITLAMDAQGKFITVKLEEQLTYTCFKKFDELDVGNNSCKLGNKNYHFRNIRGGHCYRYSLIPLPRKYALEQCVGEGGNLAIIESYSELEILRKLCEYSTRTYGQKNYDHTIIYLGFHGHWTLRKYVTVFGNPYIYESKTVSFPLSTNEECGVMMYYSYTIGGAKCSVRACYLCEADKH